MWHAHTKRSKLNRLCKRGRIVEPFQPGGVLPASLETAQQAGYAARQRNPELRSARTKRDERPVPHIQRVWEANLLVYGADKIWQQMRRDGIAVARSTVERLMHRVGLQGARRGKTVRTTVPDRSIPRPLDRVNRQFKADRPNQRR